MATESTKAFNGLFASPGGGALPSDVLSELESIARMHALAPQEVFYKWESFALSMARQAGSDPALDLASVRAFKTDVLEGLEREAREHQKNTADKKAVHATPRSVTVGAGDDFLGMLEGATPRTPASSGSIKRKLANESPAPSKSVRSTRKSSPKANGHASVVVPFMERQNAGQIVETLNSQLEPSEPPLAPPAQPRVALKANTDLKKFYYKPLAMHQLEASEVLDDRIDEFMQFVQEHHHLDNAAFGNAANKSTSEIVSVGRIASDSSEGKLNEASMVLELSRRQGAGLRVPLKFNAGISYEFFPGQIVALRGTNASGDYFSVSEVLEVPLLPPAASLPSNIEDGNARLGVDDSTEASASHALSMIIASGPYTADDNLDFEPLHALCDQASENAIDVLVLSGPFLDLEHPLIATGDFELPASASVEPDQATLADAFRAFISEPLRRLTQAHPAITIVMVPSTRDAVNKHTAWPQEPFTGLKKDLGLPKQARAVTNPCTLSFNEVVLATSAQDILMDLGREEVLLGKPSEGNKLARLPRHLVRQRHFYPLYPAGDRTAMPRPSGHANGNANGTGEDGDDEDSGAYAIGTPLDPTYLKLGEWLHVRPDILVTPSALPPFAKVVESVVAINPGPLSKRRGASTYARLAVHPRKVTAEERAQPDRLAQHQVFDRARVDIVRI